MASINNFDHVIVQYVDDTTNIISTNDHKMLQEYINKYYLLVNSYYNINFLKLNADKTKLMLTCRPQHRNIIKDIYLQAGDFIIKQSNKVKILGIYFTSGLTNEPNVQEIIKKVSFRLSILSKITKFTNIKTSLVLFNSIIISVFAYCIENLMDIDHKHQNKLNVLINKCTQILKMHR